MTREMFTMKMKETYHNIQNGMLDGMEKELQGYSENDISLIYDTVLRDSKFTPNVNSVCEAIKNIGISKNSNKKYIYECCKCSTLYAQVNSPLSAYRCPSCGSFERMVKEYTQGDKLLVMQSTCLVSSKGGINCEKYNRLLKNKREPGVYGPSCKQYTQGNTESCNSCICKDCCNNERKQIRARQNEIAKRALNKRNV